MSLRNLFATTLFALLLPFLWSQVEPADTGVVKLPQGPTTRIPSPDFRWILIFECPNNCEQRKLWLEDSTLHARRLVREYRRSLAIAWAPDSRQFFVEDDYGSNGSSSYVVNAATLKITDLNPIIANSDEEATQLVNAGHSYVRAKRWLNSHVLIVVLSGHFDEAPPRAFTRGYRVDLRGKAERFLQRDVEESQ